MAKPRGPRYGFRLYTLSPYRKHGQTPVSFYEESLYTDDATLSDDLVTIAHDNLERRYFGRLVYTVRDEDGESAAEAATEETRPAITIESVQRVGKRIDFAFRWGREGSHDIAMSRNSEDDAELSGKAASNQFFAWIYLPKSQGSAVLATEARGNLCVGPDFVKYLSVLMKERSDELGSTLDWWKLKPRQVSDDHHLSRVIRNGEASGLVLKRQRAGNMGRSVDDLILRQNWVAPKYREAAKATLVRWAKKSPRDFGLDDLAVDGDSSDQVSALMSSNIDEIDWETGSIVFEHEDATKSTYSPTEIKDMFTYPVALGARPSAVRFRTDIESRIRALMPSMKVEVELP